MPDVNSDEVLAALDSDTREYLNLLINGAGQGLKNGGGDQLAQVFERFEPTHRDLARLNSAVAVRGTNLQRLVNSLQRLNTALAKKRVQIVELVDASSKVFRAFASQQANISRAVGDLPSTLEQTMSTLTKVKTFADTLGPAAQNLLPAVKEIPTANRALIQLAGPNSANCGSASTCSIVRDQIRPFVRASRPLVQNLRPAAVNLNKATPGLSGTFQVLNHLFNMLNLGQPQGNHPYLWWLAWLDHNARTLFSQQDAVGVFRPLFVQLSCQTLQLLTNQNTAYSLVGTILNSAPGNAACKAAGLQSGPGLGLPGLNIPGLSVPTLPLPGLSKDSKKASVAAWQAAQAAGKKTTTTKKSR
jgi:phospholipid/cholesterol/gamma-HCH transport system substrate-binding protein